jgi:hypothetical protein
MFFAPEDIYLGMPPQFAYPAAFGDLLAALLALAAPQCLDLTAIETSQFGFSLDT